MITLSPRYIQSLEQVSSFNVERAELVDGTLVRNAHLRYDVR